MSGKGAAYKVATKNARRNRKRTIFLVLLVAVPVAFGVVVAGIVRATSLTQEETAQTYFGNADARFQVFSPTGDVYGWIEANLRELAPEATITELRQTGIRLEDAGVGYAQVWDLDIADPATEGLLVHVGGELPDADDEVAISPALAEAMEVEVGDAVTFEQLPYEDLTIVGLVSEPFFVQGMVILLRPDALEPLVGDPELLP
jgi:ABC-type lipoprotein release transport system permease subunit